MLYYSGVTSSLRQSVQILYLDGLGQSSLCPGRDLPKGRPGSAWQDGLLRGLIDQLWKSSETNEYARKQLRNQPKRNTTQPVYGRWKPVALKEVLIFVTRKDGIASPPVGVSGETVHFLPAPIDGTVSRHVDALRVGHDRASRDSETGILQRTFVRRKRSR
jgi:hypothetical protein